jgi:hypothetical protein
MELRLLKADLIKNPILANLPNIKFANATNFKLSPEEATALAELVSGTEAEAVRHHTYACRFRRRFIS